jgi:hypothetical protein
MPQEWKTSDIGERWFKEAVLGSEGGDPSLMSRLRDLTRLAGVIVTGVLSRRPVQPLGDEARRQLPGDELVSGNATQWTDGITIRARPTEIWPWLVQMGCRRAGWYSYDRLDNSGIPSADRIVPEFQSVEVGDVFPWTPTADDGFVVRAIKPEQALVFGEDTQFTWAIVLQPIDETSTRLVTRTRMLYENLAQRLMLELSFRPIDFGMKRRQLLNLKRSVEARVVAGSNRP